MSRRSASVAEARALIRQRAWADAYDTFEKLQHTATLSAEDLEQFWICAYLTGQEERCIEILERAYEARMSEGDDAKAARSAFWTGTVLAFRRQYGRATGWMARAQELVAKLGDCVERGYLLLPVVQQQIGAGQFEAASETAGEAAKIGTQFDDPDLVAAARQMQGRALLRDGKPEAGLAALDQAMLCATTRELSPIILGLTYCSVIEGCREVYAIERAREWTQTLERWCDGQPGLVAFTGNCRVHRSEILHLQGAWQEALQEAQRACQRASTRNDNRPPAAAFYQEAEVHRLRGNYGAAEDQYKQASSHGLEPQPGLALLRLGEGKADIARASLQRAVDAASSWSERLRLLPALVEILVANGELDAAERATSELEQLAEQCNAQVLDAMVASARGAILTAKGDPLEAVSSLRAAFAAWQALDVPYEAARTREKLGVAYRALGDEEGAALELEAAHGVFRTLRAEPDAARVERLQKGASKQNLHGLSRREVEVLKLVAAGKTNKEIADELGLSSKTIDRHVSNIFSKLRVSTRAAATAAAYEARLV